MDDQIENKVIDNQVKDLDEFGAPKITHRKLVFLLVLLVLVFVGLALIINFLADNKDANDDSDVDLNPVLTMEPTSINNSADVPSDWEVFIGQGGVQILYPPYLEDLVNSSQFKLTVRTKQEIMDEYDRYRVSGGCASTCGMFLENPALLEKQFDLLEGLNLQIGCVLDSSYKREIEEYFMLFTAGIRSNMVATSLYTNEGLCVLRVTEADGFEASLETYYYKVGLMVDDKVVYMSAPLFPTKGFEDVVDLWEGFGFDINNNSCSQDCRISEGRYFESFDYDDPLVKNVISVYDMMLYTITLIPDNLE